MTLSSAAAKNGLLPTPPMPEGLPKAELSENGRQVLTRRYLRRGLDGKPVETIEEMFWRVAYHVAKVEEKWGADVMARAVEFYHLLVSKKFFPNSPTFTGAGTPLGQLAACFVLPISDDMGRKRSGIFQTLRDAALIQQTGGGNGFSFSRLRPKGTIVQSSAGEATGPVGFLRVYDKAFGEIAQGGTRRGANMAVLRVDHPDIEEFITCKTDENAITNFNISVGITDAFMRAVENDEEWELRFPDVTDPRYRGFDGTLEEAEAAGLPIKVYKKVRARELFEKMVRQAHHNGEPGVLFLDVANRSNPVPHLYALEATNPCGEQWLGPYENCCLGSINLNEHCGPNGTVDWETLRQSVETATRFLDDVVEANAYVPAVPQLKEAAHRARRIGLGIMGLADLMYHVEVRYGSEEGQEFAAQVMEFIRYHAMRTSIRLAEERGPFPAIQGSIYDPQNLKWQPPRSIVPYRHDWGRPEVDWQEIVGGIRRHGIRNAAQTTIAPTGTIATVAGTEGYGCEPVFALAYIRHVNDKGRDLQLTYASARFERALTQAGIPEEKRQEIFERVLHEGTCQNIAEIPESIRHVFVVAGDISAEEHVRMQAALQAFVDNSISKCVVGDTLLLTERGLVPIETLSDLRLPDQFAPLACNVVTPKGVQAATLFYYGGYRETRKVALEYGFELEGTPNHRIHVLDERGEVVFRRLDELRPGDLVVLYAGQQQFGPSAAPLPPFSGQFRTNGPQPTFPERMSTDLAFLLGCITSKGAIPTNGVSISSFDLALLEQLQGIARRLFGLEGDIAGDSRNQVHYLQLNSRALRDWLIADLGLQPGAEDKAIPPCILGASQDEIAAFLRGLFQDGFMSTNGKLFGITFAGRRLVAQLQVLLLNAGIVATSRQVGERAYSLTVQGADLERLAEWIGFVEVWKDERSERRDLGRLQRYRNYNRLLPERITEALVEMGSQVAVSLRAISQLEEGAEFQTYQQVRVNLVNGHRLEREDAHRLYQVLRRAGGQHDLADRFFGHDDERKVYLSVEKVEAGFAEVFDISVPESHTFIANGFANHNTINFPEDATVEDVATAYRLAWELGCKGLTVYVTGSREKVVLETKATAEKKQSAVSSTSQPQPMMWHESKKPRPRVLPGRTYSIETPLGKAFITINENGFGQPFEVFINTSKAGSETAAVSEAIGRLISFTLRLASPVAPLERVREIVQQLIGIGGGRSLGFGPNRVRSLPDGVGQVLEMYLQEKEGKANGDGAQLQPLSRAQETSLRPMEQPMLQIGDLCPECGEAAVVNEEGCRKCYACGYSEC